MNKVLEEISKIGIIPVVVLEDSKDAKPLAKALIDGNLPAAEVTFRTDAAEESIRIMSENYPELLVGAGTVLTTGQAAKAIEAGAKFIVSPGLDPEVVEYCREKQVLALPGTITPSEVITGMNMGLNVLKFFPAEPAGGLDMINAMCAAFTTMKFMPTGGINPNNVEKYLKNDKIIACGGSWMVKADLIADGKFDEIKLLCQEAHDLVEKIRG